MSSSTQRSRVFKRAVPRIFAGSLLAALLALAGCGPPPPPPPTLVTVQINAGADTNLGTDGQGAPVAVRVYQLAARPGFERAEFYPLFNADVATLGPDLLKKDELLIIPGSSKTLTLSPTDAVHAIGVFAAYRDFQNVVWRVAGDVPAHQSTVFTVTADRTGLKLVLTPGKPASP